MNQIDKNYFYKYRYYFSGMSKQEIFNFLMLASGLENIKKEDSSKKVKGTFG